MSKPVKAVAEKLTVAEPKRAAAKPAPYILTTVPPTVWYEGVRKPGYQTWLSSILVLSPEEWDRLCNMHSGFKDHVDAAAKNRIPPHRVLEKRFTKVNTVVMEEEVGFSKVLNFSVMSHWYRSLLVRWTPVKNPAGKSSSFGRVAEKKAQKPERRAPKRRAASVRGVASKNARKIENIEQDEKAPQDQPEKLTEQAQQFAGAQ